MRKLIFIIVFFLLALGVKSQMLDSLKFFIQENYSIAARLESRLSLIDHELTKVSGVRVGLTFKRKLRLGCGVDWLKTNYSRGLNLISYQPISRDFMNTNNELISKYYKLMYFCLYADFVFHKTKHWQLSVPIQVGMGATWFDQNKNYKLGAGGPKYFVFLYEPGISVQYKITKWFGGGIDFCYRFALQGKGATTLPLNSPSYALKLIFLLDQLFFEIFPSHQLTKDYGPANW